MRLALLANASVIHTRRWGDYFHTRGHQVELISLEPFAPGEDYDYPCHVVPWRMPWRFLRYPLAVPHVKELLARFRPELVNAHFVPNYGLIGVLAGRRPLAVSVWGSDVLISGRKSPLHRARARFVLARADLVTTDAAMLTRAARALGDLSPERVLTVPMGVDPAIYRAARGDAGGVAPLVISTRKLEPIYNVSLLVDALPALVAAVPGVEVEVVGDGPERSTLEARARIHAGKRVRFLGTLPHAEIARALARAQVYVSTTRSDSTSVSLLEAMASGAFPVVTDIEANREWIEDGVNGFLCPAEPRVLAERVATALSDPALRARAAAENARIIEERADWRKNMAEVEALFEKLAAGGSGQ